MLLRPIFIGALAWGVLATGAWGEDLTADEKAFLDQHVSDVIKTEPVRLSDPAVIKAFATPFYKLTVTIQEGDGGTNSNSLIVARRDDKLVGISRPSTDGDCPDIQKMFRPDFKLKSDADARVLQAAFDAIFPIIGSGDQKVATFKHTGNQWIFVRGEFFDSLMGFVVTTDGGDAVTGVKFVMKLP